MTIRGVTVAKRRRRRKRIVTDDLTLRSFRDRDVDAFVLGLEQQAAPVDRFDRLANIDAVVKRDRRLSRKRLFAELAKAQDSATIYGNPGLRFQIFSRGRTEWMGYVAIYNARWNDRRWRNLRVYSALATDDLFPERPSLQSA